MENQLQRDISFARNCNEFVLNKGGKIGSFQTCPMMRYVATLNPRATRAAFVSAMVDFGYNAATAKTQFMASRKFDLINYGGSVDKDGRYTQGESK